MPNNSHIMQGERTTQRFTRNDPCPVCGGYESLGRGRGVRCFGYYDSSARYARCTREDRAGGLPQNRDGTYSHRLHGQCRCGQVHGDATAADVSHLSGPRNSQRKRSEQRFRSCFTLTAFLRRRYGEGTDVRSWIYRDAAGQEVFRVLRLDYDAPDGTKAKSYRPCHNGNDGRWRLSRPDGPLPLYNLPFILAAPPEAIITILEGEKCAEIATALGLPHATASAHGAQAPWLSDWSPLAGRSVAILPDEGERGADYAAKVAGILADLDPPAAVRIVHLPGLSEGDDIEQWIAARRLSGQGDAEILAELSALIAPPR
jgi:hypothetical protein